MKMSVMDWIVWVLLFVGGLDWGTVGFFKYDFVAKWFGSGDITAVVPRIIYALVGLAALWSLFTVFSKMSNES
jgi:uncharacterized membrane protein YuzA (DUF378 family)